MTFFNSMAKMLTNYSDLLTRHMRLHHNIDPAESSPPDQQAPTLGLQEKGSHTSQNDIETQDSPFPHLVEMEAEQPIANPFIPTTFSQAGHGPDASFPLNALSIAAEQVVLQQLHNGSDQVGNSLADSHINNFEVRHPAEHPVDVPAPCGMQFEEGFDAILSAETYNAVFSHYMLPPIVPTEQPYPFFTQENFASISEGPQMLGLENAFDDGQGIQHAPGAPEASNGRTEHSRFRLGIGNWSLPDITRSDWDAINQAFDDFQYILPTQVQLPSRNSLSRYISAFRSGFHQHMPFLHFPTFSINRCAMELLLAIAAVGAHYRFEPEVGAQLFGASEAIAKEKLRCADAFALVGEQRPSQSQSDTSQSSGHATSSNRRMTTTNSATNVPMVATDCDLQMMQTLLLLMAIGTWARQEAMTRKGLQLQTTLALLIRRHGLYPSHKEKSQHWDIWAHYESAKRTKLITFCFFNLHSLLYNLPSPIPLSDIHLALPSTTSIFEAAGAEEWIEACQTGTIKEHQFRESFQQLLHSTARTETFSHSATGNYVLIHALLQHIFYARQLGRSFLVDGEVGTSDYLSGIETALRNWQRGWQRGWQQNSDLSLDLAGPVAFNCVALLRLAYIRMNVDIGPCRVLEIRDPKSIARAFLTNPRPPRSPQLLRAVIHSAHALSIPIKIGIKFVAQTQAVFWSIQHSLCSLECAVLLSCWLDSIANENRPSSGPSALDGTERRVIVFVQSLLNDCAFGVGYGRDVHEVLKRENLKRLASGVVRVWAGVFQGPQTWAIVEVMGASLELYAELLEADSTP